MTTTALLVDLDVAGAALSLSRRTVQQLIYTGALPSVKVGRARRIAVIDLETFVAQLRHDSGVPELKVV